MSTRPKPVGNHCSALSSSPKFEDGLHSIWTGGYIKSETTLDNTRYLFDLIQFTPSNRNWHLQKFEVDSLYTHYASYQLTLLPPWMIKHYMRRSPLNIFSTASVWNTWRIRTASVLNRSNKCKRYSTSTNIR